MCCERFALEAPPDAMFYGSYKNLPLAYSTRHAFSIGKLRL